MWKELGTTGVGLFAAKANAVPVAAGLEDAAERRPFREWSPGNAQKAHSRDWLCHQFGAEKNLPKCDIVTLATLNCLISDGCYATLPVFDFSRFEAA